MGYPSAAYPYIRPGKRTDLCMLSLSLILQFSMLIREAEEAVTMETKPRMSRKSDGLQTRSISLAACQRENIGIWIVRT